MDFLINENFELLIEDGDFAVGDATEQQVIALLQAEQGHYKQFPLTGCGIRSLVGGNLTPDVKRRTQLQLESDGLKVGKISMIDQDLKIELR
jgi:hypothetical protein